MKKEHKKKSIKEETMLKREVLGEKLMKGVKAGLRECLEEGGCDCTGGGNFNSSSDVWLDHIDSSGDPE